jgi:hypothetical protein
MAKAKSTRTTRSRPKKRGAPAPRVPAPDASATSRALVDLEESRDPDAERDGSVEDPLHDWPESADDTDEWLRERDADGIEREPDK